MVDIKKYGIEPFGATPNARQVAHYKIGKKVFFHFGVNTFTNKEWGDGSEVEKLFAPTELDTDQWLRIAKEAGFKLAILTVKHHDGFCLWPSAYTEHSVKNSPYKNGQGDVVREFVDSCHKYGLKVGVYISPWDRHSPYWGKPDYSNYFAAQLTELMTGYGEIDEVWWDGAGSREAKYDWDLWESIVRENQPKAAIFGSMGAAGHIDLRWVGNEGGHAGATHYASVDLQDIVDEVRSALNEGSIGAKAYVPTETDVSIRPGWFYHSDQDDNVKSVSKINKIWFESVGRNSMMLLSFPPDTRGLVCDKDAENAIASNRCIEKMLSVNYADIADMTVRDGSVMTVVDDADGEEIKVFDGKVLDIILPEAKKINVFTIGELIEAGERITSFKLESVEDNGECRTLYEGTSVGFYKAVQIEEGEYRRLRFSVTGAMASPLLRGVGLHYYEAPADAEVIRRGDDIVKSLEKASDDGYVVDAIFGGIYPFDHVEFTADKQGFYKIYAFSGQDYELICEGEGGCRLGVNLPYTVTESYRIRIERNSKITDVVVKLR